MTTTQESPPPPSIINSHHDHKNKDTPNSSISSLCTSPSPKPACSPVGSIPTAFCNIYDSILGLRERQCFLYFSYGSNIYDHRLRLSNPSAKFICIAKLPSYVLSLFKVENCGWGGPAAASLTYSRCASHGSGCLHRSSSSNNNNSGSGNGSSNNSIDNSVLGVIWMVSNEDSPNLDAQESAYEKTCLDVYPIVMQQHHHHHLTALPSANGGIVSGSNIKGSSGSGSRYDKSNPIEYRSDVDNSVHIGLRPIRVRTYILYPTEAYKSYKAPIPPLSSSSSSLASSSSSGRSSGSSSLIYYSNDYPSIFYKTTIYFGAVKLQLPEYYIAYIRNMKCVYTHRKPTADTASDNGDGTAIYAAANASDTSTIDEQTTATASANFSDYAASFPTPFRNIVEAIENPAEARALMDALRTLIQHPSTIHN